MPEGEHSWKNWKGPRKVVSSRIPAETQLVIAVAAGHRGISVNRLVGEILERWAEDWLRDNLEEIRVAVATGRR